MIVVYMVHAKMHTCRRKDTAGRLSYRRGLSRRMTHGMACNHDKMTQYQQVTRAAQTTLHCTGLGPQLLAIITEATSNQRVQQVQPRLCTPLTIDGSMPAGINP